MILITGAIGLLGANLVADYSARGLPVLAVARKAIPEAHGGRWQSCDLTVDSDVRALMDRWRPTSIIHCAAMTNVDQCECERELAWATNAEMPGKLAALASEYGARFVYISTDSVFDGRRGNYSESDAVGPLNVYAASKLGGEQAVLSALPGAAIVRTNIYGWNMQQKSSLAEWVLGQLESGAAISGFEDVIFCPLLVNDLGDAIAQMLEKELSGIYHVTGSEAINKFEFARRIAVLFGYKTSGIRATSIEQSVLKAPRSKNTSLDTGKIGGALGRRMPDVNEGLARFRQLRESGYVAALKAGGE